MPTLSPHHDRGSGGHRRGGVEEKGGDDASIHSSWDGKGGTKGMSKEEQQKVYFRKKMADLAKFWEAAQWYVELIPLSKTLAWTKAALSH